MPAPPEHQEVSNHRDRFLSDCLRISPYEFLAIAFTGIRSFKIDSRRLIATLNGYAASAGLEGRFSRRDEYILGSVHAIASVLIRSTGMPVGSWTAESVSDAAVVYSAITMTDAWIDSGRKTIDYKRAYIRRVRDVLVLGAAAPVPGDGPSLLAAHVVLLRFAHERLSGAPGWDDFVADFDRLVRAGDREFSAAAPAACLAATVLVGAYSAAAIFNAIFIDATAQGRRQAKRRVMRLGAIMNLIDDIFDHSDDIRAGRRTFITESASVANGQEQGYAKCVEIWRSMASAAGGRLGAMQNTAAIWWLRNRFNAGDLTLREVAAVLAAR